MKADCTCMYCHDGLCFKPGRAEDDVLAIPCDGCHETQEPTAEALHIIV